MWFGEVLPRIFFVISCGFYSEALAMAGPNEQPLVLSDALGLLHCDERIARWTCHGDEVIRRLSHLLKSF